MATALASTDVSHVPGRTTVRWVDCSHKLGSLPCMTEPRGVVGFEVILGAYASLLSMAATGSVSLVS